MITFRRVPDGLAPDLFALHVTWARIPVLWWRDVAVLVEEPVELTMLDRFTVESTQRLGRLTAVDFHEFTGLSDLVFAALARRLHTLGLVDWRGTELHPNPREIDLDADTPASRTTVEALDFLYLPQSDDLIAVTEGLDEFERVRPQRRAVAALPDRLHGMSRRDLLAERITSRKVVGLPPQVVGVADVEQDEPLTAMTGARPEPAVPVCPVIECSALVVPSTDGPQVNLDLGKRRRRRGKENGDGVPVTISLGNAAGLVAEWKRIATKTGDPANQIAVVHAIADIPLDPQSLRYTIDQGYSLGLTSAQAAEMAKRGPLTKPIGIEIHDEHAHIAVAIRLTPADTEAELIFTTDELIDRILTRSKNVTTIMATEADLVDRVGGPHTVAQRAWALGHFWITHQLREATDFSYA